MKPALIEIEGQWFCPDAVTLIEVRDWSVYVFLRIDGNEDPSIIIHCRSKAAAEVRLDAVVELVNKARARR